MDLQELWAPIAKRTNALIQLAQLYINDHGENSQLGTFVDYQFLVGLRQAYDQSCDFVDECFERGLAEFQRLYEQIHAKKGITSTRLIPNEQEISQFKKHELKTLVKEWLLSISLMETEITGVLHDHQLGTRSKTELAFRHLQRSLAVDLNLRRQWLYAFSKHETVCEALGATHLLWHGLWAFKADATGARTDLIVHEPVNLREVGASGAALVLTEWKRIKNPTRGTIDAAFQEAKNQALSYRSGILASLELRSVVYLVAVSLHPISKEMMPLDTHEAGKTIRHINLVVQPPTPSVMARLARRKRGRGRK